MVGRRGAGRVRPRPAPAFSPSLTSLPLISILFPEDAALPVLFVRANAMLTLWILLPMACGAPDLATQVFYFAPRLILKHGGHLPEVHDFPNILLFKLYKNCIFTLLPRPGPRDDI